MIRTTKGFTLVEIMIVMAIMGIVVAIAAPTWFRQREISRSAACQENLTKIQGSMEQYALEFRLPQGGAVNFPQDLISPNNVGAGNGYLRAVPNCPSSGVYATGGIGSVPTCSIGTNVGPFAPHTMP